MWPVKNTSGLIVGISQTDAPDPYGENWSCSAFFLLGAPTSVGRQCLGFVWKAGKMQRLPTLGGTHGFAAAVNNHRQIVGWAETDIIDRDNCEAPQLFLFRAVVWGSDGKQIHELYPGDDSSAATAVNDKGQIVGISGTCDQAIGRKTALHAVLWDNGTVEDIGNLGGKEWNTPTAINERGDIAGFSDHEGEAITEAFLWTREGGIEGLGFLDTTHVLSEAFGINDRRQIVGLSCGAACRAFLWQDGAMADLNDLVPAQPGIVLTHAMDINDDGVITGRALNSVAGELLAYVATRVAGSQLVLKRDARPRGALSRQGRAVTVELPADVMRQILSPFGPGRTTGRSGDALKESDVMAVDAHWSRNRRCLFNLLPSGNRGGDGNRRYRQQCHVDVTASTQ